MLYEDGFVQGSVVSVDTFYAYFEIEGNLKVHMSVLMAKNETQMLPQPGSKVFIRKFYRSGSTLVACGSLVVDGDFILDNPPSAFLNLVSLFELEPSHIFMFDELAEKIEKNFVNLDAELRTDVLLSVLQNITLRGRRESAAKGDSAKYSLTTVNSCKYVEIQSDKFTEFPYWSFGAHPNKENTMLFGSLEIHPVYGFFVLRDCHHHIVCVITENSKSDIEITRFINSYVLIEKYTIITEIFNNSHIPNIEYIIADVEHINVIYYTKRAMNLFGNKPEGLDFPNCMHLIVLKKSTVCVGPNDSPELILQVFVKFANKIGHACKEIYLVLPSVYVSIYMHFKMGSSYMLHYKTLLREITNIELTRVKNLKIYKILDRDCYFEPIKNECETIPDPLTVSECKSYIETGNDLVSFRGTIKNKRFTNPLPSRTIKKSEIYGFGVQGDKGHQIVFSHTSDRATIFLDCYLNNWENKLMPLGLVPEMEVIVRNVYPQSKKYLKSTILTTFELVSYNPRVRFNTVNLFSDFDSDWGVQSWLSEGPKFPVGVLVWGQIHSIFMLKVNIASKCAKCKIVISRTTRCSCEDVESQIEFFAQFNAMDRLGKNLVATKCLKVLSVILGIQSKDYNEWVQSLHNIGTYSYNFFENVIHYGIPLCDYLTEYFQRDRRLILDLKCRSLEPSNLKDKSKPYWYCIDVRRR